MKVRMEGGEGNEGEGRHLDGHLLPHVVLGGGGPHQERAHVLRQLALGDTGFVFFRLH